MIEVYGINTFTLNRHGGYDAYNVPQASTSTSKTGFIDRRQHRVVNDKGQDVMSAATIEIMDDSTITTKDTVTFDGRTWVIVGIDRPQGFTAYGPTVLHLV